MYSISIQIVHLPALMAHRTTSSRRQTPMWIFTPARPHSNRPILILRFSSLSVSTWYSFSLCPHSLTQAIPRRKLCLLRFFVPLVFDYAGGWAFNDPPTQNIFSNMAASSSNRQKFISSLITFFQVRIRSSIHSRLHCRDIILSYVDVCSAFLSITPFFLIAGIWIRVSQALEKDQPLQSIPPSLSLLSRPDFELTRLIARFYR